MPLLELTVAMTMGVAGIVHLTQPPSTAPLEFALQDNVSPDGVAVTANNNSISIGGVPWVGAAGEIHFARVPEDQWGMELQKIKAGGMSVVDTYLFWIHHEEVQGTYVWDGRRNVRNFLELCHSLDLKVMLRVGPWCHGETRNGGHPDWLIAASKKEHFKLRSNDTQYLQYAKGWYTEIAAQTKGLYYKDGGPIIFVQNGNENQDTDMLQSLRNICLEVGITPAAFTVTTVNTPPKAFPFLQFVGAYPDRFWSNSMSPTVDTAGYYFTPASSNEYPPLSVEIGGGMEVAYHHRPHMYPNDMPSYHLCHFASGLNWMGYYMYHGGNNPVSASGDAPEAGYQESSFQPAGAANPMPSKTYDFFAAIGEFGQIRGHYHGMRQHGMFSADYGAHYATTFVNTPDNAAQPGDMNSLRWTARSDGHSGYVFVNNYQRLATLPPQNDTSFFVIYGDGSGSLKFPSFNFTVPSGAWFFFPFNIGAMRYATATPLCKAGEYGHIFRSIAGIPVELSLNGWDVAKILVSSGTVTNSSGIITFTNITPSRKLAVSVLLTSSETVDFVFLSPEDGERTWKGVLNGQEYVVVANQEVETVMMNGSRIDIRSTNTSTVQTILSMYPEPKSFTIDGTAAAGVKNGYFYDYTWPKYTPSLPGVVVEKVADAGPPRDVPYSPAGDAEEPTEADWGKAAKYNLTIGGIAPPSSVDTYLAIRYEGDSARVSLNNVLLTDNWYTGYTGPGEMQIGLSYLAGEYPSLLADSVTLELSILPLKQTTVSTFVYLNKEYWPTFDSNGVALTLKEVVTLGSSKQTAIVG
eukprot:TRINITY_DN3951_c0_g1_i1.p1 TRINITY_DN3951_c0_g1~~TRINITY_DN3951_c0_g1_i1.p1  ORF type:complete len:815 (+),score=172.87 TRINITY_DN3951_c0_g1_i1:35-2446(+)